MSPPAGSVESWLCRTCRTRPFSAPARAGRQRTVGRLWARDAALWTGGDEARWLGWLDAPERERATSRRCARSRRTCAAPASTTRCCSAWAVPASAPRCWRRSFGRPAGHPRAPRARLHRSGAGRRVRGARVDPARRCSWSPASRASRSSPTSCSPFFFDARAAAVGDAAGGAALRRHHRSRLEAGGARRAPTASATSSHGVPEIGGRYSALSHFGLVPAAVLGVDFERLLERRRGDGRAPARRRRRGENPGVALGIVLGEAARARTRQADADRLAAASRDLGAWLEQLIAESTGKQGRGIIPVDGERLATPASTATIACSPTCGSHGEPDPAQDAAVDALERAGQPVVRIDVADRCDARRRVLPLGVRHRGRGRGPRHPSVRPARRRGQQDRDAQADRRDRAHRRAAGGDAVPAEAGIALFADAANAAALPAASSLVEVLRAHLVDSAPAITSCWPTST